VREYVWRLPRGEANFVTVIVAEQFAQATLLDALRHRETFQVKRRLLAEVGIAVADVTNVGTTLTTLPKRITCRVIASGAHAASMRAVNYAKTLGITDTKAVFFAHDETQAGEMRTDWQRHDFDLPLEAVEAPYRDVGSPLLRYIRDLCIDEETLVSVVMPEVIVAGWRELLHNQRALYIKRLLLFEPRVVLTSVPYQIIT